MTSCVHVDPFISSVSLLRLSAAYSTRGLVPLQGDQSIRRRGKVSTVEAENGAAWTGGGVQAAASLLAGGRAGAGSGPPPSACVVDDAH